MRQLPAQLCGCGLLGELIDQFMPRYPQSSSLLLEPIQQGQPLRGGQRAVAVPDDPGHRAVQCVEVLLDLLTIS